MYTPTHTIPNKSHRGEGLRAFPARGNRHPLSCQSNKIMSRMIYISSAVDGRSSAGWSSSPMPEGEQKEQETGNLIENIVKENFPNLVEEINIQVQVGQRILNKMDKRRTIPRHIIIKMP